VWGLHQSHSRNASCRVWWIALCNNLVCWHKVKISYRNQGHSVSTLLSLSLKYLTRFLWTPISEHQPTTSTTWPCWESFVDVKQYSHATSISQQLASAHVYWQLIFCSLSSFVPSLLVQVYGWMSEDGTRTAGGSSCGGYDLILVDLLTGNVTRFHCRRVAIMNTHMMIMRLVTLWPRCELHIIFGLVCLTCCLQFFIECVCKYTSKHHIQTWVLILKHSTRSQTIAVHLTHTHQVCVLSFIWFFLTNTQGIAWINWTRNGSCSSGLPTAALQMFMIGWLE
jgi:hypothetical protein